MAGAPASWAVRSSLVRDPDSHRHPTAAAAPAQLAAFAREVHDGESTGSALADVLHQIAQGDEDEEADCFQPTSAIFDASLLDLFELARRHLQQQEQQQAEQIESSDAPWVLLLTATTPSELQQTIRAEKAQWQAALAQHRRRADAHSHSYMQLMQSVEIR